MTPTFTIKILKRLNNVGLNSVQTKNGSVGENFKRNNWKNLVKTPASSVIAGDYVNLAEKFNLDT